MATSKLNDYQVFPREYFSGIDCYISFNNIPLDEIVAIEFAVQEPVIPIYGYASYTYDAVAHGSRIVNGSFTINFKESLYIRSALIKLSDQKTSSVNPKKPNPEMNQTELLAWIKGRNFTDIEKLANEYSDNIWSNSTDVVVNKQTNPFFTTQGSALSSYGFDIILSYGSELIEIGKKIKDFPGTVKIINGVHLTGVNQVIKPSGEPIYEQYMFMAKDLDNTI